MVLPWKTCESRGLALHNAEGQGGGSASLGTEGWGHQDPLAALRILLHPGTGRGRWVLRVLCEGSPVWPCLALWSQLSASPQVLSGCCWFRSQLCAVEGRHLVGSQRAPINLSGRRAWPAVVGEQWVPRGSSSRCISETWILSVQSAAVSMGSPVKQSDETTWAGVLMVPCWAWDHSMAVLVPLHLLSEPRGEFPVAERYVLHRFPSRAYLCSPP